MMLLAAVLALHVTLEDATSLRLVSTGTGDLAVTWSIGGIDLAETNDGQAALIDVPAGTHVLWAQSDEAGEWRVLARPAVGGSGQASYVPAWTAVHRAEVEPETPLVPSMLALAALMVAFGRGRSLLQAAPPAARVED